VLCTAVPDRVSLRKDRWEADQADRILGITDVTVAAAIAVHGVSVPWRRVDADGSPVVPVRQISDLLEVPPPILGLERVAGSAVPARLRFA
jgi:hypothetical protein